jgi:hypothetical protein
MKASQRSQTRTLSERRWEPADWQCIVLLAGLVVLFFHRILLGNAFLWEDFLYQWYPFRQFAASSMAEGDLPLWNPYNFNGMPFLADIQTQIFYLPLTALALFVKDGHLGVFWLEFVNITHYLVAGVGMFYLAKSFALRQIPALFAAVVYTFSGFMITHAIHQIIITLVCWYPWVLLLMRMAFAERSWRWVFVGGVLLGHTFFAGFPQLSLFLYFFLAVYVVFELLSTFGFRGLITRPALVMMAKAGAIVALSAGVMMIQLLPTLELSKLSVRAEITYEKSTEGSLAWSQLSTFLFPKLFGTAGATGYNYWGPGTYWYYWETCIYLGALPIFLTLLSALFARRSKYIPFFLGFALFSLFFALGGNFVVQKFFFYYIPVFSTFRNPSRMTVFLALGVALLSAFVLQYLLYEPDTVRRARFLKTLLFSSVGAGVLAWALLVSGSLTTLFPFLARPEISSFVKREAQISLVFILLSGAVLYWMLVGKKAVGRTALAGIAVLFADMYVFGESQNTSSVNPEEYFKSAEPIVRFLRSDPDIFRVNTRTTEGMIMDRNQGMVDRIFTMEGYTPLVLQRAYPPVATTDQMFDLLNVKYATVADEGRGMLSLRPHPTYMPRAFMMYRYRVLTDEKELLAYLKSPGFDPHTVAVLEQDPGVMLAELHETPTWSARVEKYSNNAIALQAKTSHDGLLILSEIYYPGWEAYVDGQETALYRTDYNLRGLFLPKGQHHVEMRFRSSPFMRGMIVTLASLIVCGVGIAASVVRLRRKPDGKGAE